MLDIESVYTSLCSNTIQSSYGIKTFTVNSYLYHSFKLAYSLFLLTSKIVKFEVITH